MMIAASALQIIAARSFWARFKGLMFTRELAPNRALLIRRCSSVHTMFMRYPLDVVFVDASGVVVKIAAHVRPWRASWGGARAVHTLELAAGAADQLRISIGDRLYDSLNPQRPRLSRQSAT